MKAVFRHELASHFTGLTGYVFSAFLLFFAGIYTMVYNLHGGYTNFEYVLGAMSFVFLVIVPILTMRTLAEERRQKTSQLLYSLPISMTQVVLGKYAALLVIFALPTAILCLYPLILSAYGSVNIPAAYASIAAFFGLGAALIAMGMYISSITESQAVAAGLCFLAMLLNYFIADLASFVSTSAFASLAAFAVLIALLCIVIFLMTKNGFAALMSAAALEGGLMLLYTFKSSLFEGLFPEIMENLSLFEHLYDTVNGVFDLTSLVYYAGVAGVFLFLSVQSMEKGRWSE